MYRIKAQNEQGWALLNWQLDYQTQMDTARARRTHEAAMETQRQVGREQLLETQMGWQREQAAAEQAQAAALDKAVQETWGSIAKESGIRAPASAKELDSFEAALKVRQAGLTAEQKKTEAEKFRIAAGAPEGIPSSEVMNWWKFVKTQETSWEETVEDARKELLRLKEASFDPAAPTTPEILDRARQIYKLRREGTPEPAPPPTDGIDKRAEKTETKPTETRQQKIEQLKALAQQGSPTVQKALDKMGVEWR